MSFCDKECICIIKSYVIITNNILLNMTSWFSTYSKAIKVSVSLN